MPLGPTPSGGEDTVPLCTTSTLYLLAMDDFPRASHHNSLPTSFRRDTWKIGPHATVVTGAKRHARPVLRFSPYAPSPRRSLSLPRSEHNPNHVPLIHFTCSILPFARSALTQKTCQSVRATASPAWSRRRERCAARPSAKPAAGPDVPVPVPKLGLRPMNAARPSEQ